MLRCVGLLVDSSAKISRETQAVFKCGGNPETIAHIISSHGKYFQVIETSQSTAQWQYSFTV